MWTLIRHFFFCYWPVAFDLDSNEDIFLRSIEQYKKQFLARNFHREILRACSLHPKNYLADLSPALHVLIRKIIFSVESERTNINTQNFFLLFLLLHCVSTQYSWRLHFTPIHQESLWIDFFSHSFRIHVKEEKKPVFNFWCFVHFLNLYLYRGKGTWTSMEIERNLAAK